MMNQVELHKVCDVIAGQSPPSSTYNQEGEGIPFFQGKADFGELYPTVRYWCTAPKKLSEPNDILFSLRAPVGPTNINNLQSSIGRGLAAIRCHDEIELKYLLHYLRGNEERIAALGTGSTFKAIKIGTLKELKIPLPPIETQRKIAAILDTADEYRQKTKALIDKYDELAQSLFLDMFGDPVTNPKGWETTRMDQACTKVTDGTHDTPDRIKEGVQFITGKHISPYRIDFEGSDFVAPEVHQEIYRRCNPEKGDVLYTNIGANVGTAAYNSVEYEFSMKNVALFKPEKSQIHGRFLEYYLNSRNMKREVIRIASLGGAQQFLSLKDLRKLNIAVPPMDLQEKFADHIHAIFIQTNEAYKGIAKSEELFNSLLQKAFKGELA